MAYYLNEHKFFDDECVVYKTAQSPKIWQCRIWIREDKKYIRKSLKTRHIDTATERAKDLYLEIQGNIRIGKSPFSLTTRKAVDEYLEFRKQDVGTRIVKGRHVTMTTHLKHWLDFVGRETKLDELERRSCLQYFNWRKKKTKNAVKDVTLKNEQSTINACWNYLYKERHTNFEAFEFLKLKPVTNVDDIRRATLTTDEYRDLTNYLRSYCSKKTNKDKDEYIRRQFVRLYILTLANTGLRVGEALQLKWKNVKTYNEKVDGKNLRLAEITVLAKTSKVRKDRYFIARRGDLFDEIKELQDNEFCSDKDYVFNIEGNAITKRMLYWHWDKICESLGLERKQRNLTYYSLRHFFITQRINNGATFLMLSKICGTSMTQLEQTYYHVDTKQLTDAILSKNIA